MKKIVLSIFCVLLIAVSFTGCGNKNTGASSKVSSGSSAASQNPTDEILSQLEDTNSMLGGMDNVTSSDISIPNP